VFNLFVAIYRSQPTAKARKLDKEMKEYLGQMETLVRNFHASEHVWMLEGEVELLGRDTARRWTI
jgi:hypothetical protein